MKRLPSRLVVLFAFLPIVLLVGVAQAQPTRQIVSGKTSGGVFNLVVNGAVPLGEEAFSLLFYDSDSTMQLRRTPYSTVRYTYAGIDASGTLHLERRFRWEARNIDTTLDVQVKLETPLAFGTSYASPHALLRFSGGENGLLRVTLVNEADFERPKNLGF